MGGDSQPQVLLQLLARTLHGGQSPGPAMAASRWALGAVPSAGDGATSAAIGFRTWQARGEVEVRIEGHAPAAWDELSARGHRVRRTEAFDHGFGHAQLIAVAGDHLAGASDPRARGGAAVGW
jgi:gamma-glutamyltranspeptidase/glutathione hydrolase